MKSLAEAIEANRARQREKRARGYTVTSEPGYTFVGPSVEVVLQALTGIPAVQTVQRTPEEGGTP